MSFFTGIWHFANDNFGPCVHLFRKDLNCIEMLFFMILCKPLKVVLQFLLPLLFYCLKHQADAFRCFMGGKCEGSSSYFFTLIGFPAQRVDVFCAINNSFSPEQRKSLMRAQPLSLTFLKYTFPLLFSSCLPF